MKEEIERDENSKFLLKILLLYLIFFFFKKLAINFLSRNAIEKKVFFL
jgi:hypothetical protein